MPVADDGQSLEKIFLLYALKFRHNARWTQLYMLLRTVRSAG